MHVYLYSGFPVAGTPRPSAPPSGCKWRKLVSESASGIWQRMAAWEQISCSCVYLVLTVHTGLFFHCPWAYQHTISLHRRLYLLASGLKMGRHRHGSKHYPTKCEWCGILKNTRRMMRCVMCQYILGLHTAGNK